MGAAESTIAASYRLLQPDGSPVSGTPAAGDGAHPRLFAAVHKATGTRASVFRFSLPLHSGTSGVAVPAGSGASLGSPAADDMAGVQHGAGGAAAADDIASVLASGMNRLKTMRHPGIIKFVSGEVRGGTAFVVTEPVQRISAALPAMCEEEVCLGIFNLLPKDPQSSRDCFALGRVISTIIAPLVSQQKLAPSSTAFAWGQLNDLTTQLSVRSPSERPTVRMVLDAPFFRNNVLIEIVERFLKQIRVIAPAFKERMFQQLFTKFQCLPSKTVNDFVLPMLLKYELFSEPGADEFFLELLSPSPALPARPISSPFEPQPVISRDAYARHIVPFIRRAFTVRQFETRLFLLRALDRFVDVACDVDETLLESVVIPEVCLMGTNAPLPNRC
nr:Protein-associating with the carboxyl-terminal domain of ezrin [Polyrhizophydium stewartii]